MVDFIFGSGKVLSKTVIKFENINHGIAITLFYSDWIIIFFVIHLDAFKVEKMEGSIHWTVFTSGTQFGKVGSENFRECFKASNEVFWG